MNYHIVIYTYHQAITMHKYMHIIEKLLIKNIYYLLLVPYQTEITN